MPSGVYEHKKRGLNIALRIANAFRRGTHDCEECGIKFEHRGASKAANRFCSVACSAKHNTHSPHTCAVCGLEFKHKGTSHRANKCCSRECGFKYLSQVAAERREASESERWEHWCFARCAVCDSLFRKKSKASRTCSHECSIELGKKENRERYVPRPPKELTCRECGSVFLGPDGTMFCSTRCAGRVAKRSRRSRVPTAWEDRPYFIDVYDKANGKCHICGLPTIKHVEGMHPLKATIDHVFPVSRHGENRSSNCSIAHSVCNGMKGADLYVDTWLRRRCGERVTALMEMGWRVMDSTAPTVVDHLRNPSV